MNEPNSGGAEEKDEPDPEYPIPVAPNVARQPRYHAIHPDFRVKRATRRLMKATDIPTGSMMT